MSSELSMDQYRGKKNIVADDSTRLGEVGYIDDVTRTGQMVIKNSPMLIKVRIVKNIGASALNPGEGCFFDPTAVGTSVDGVSDATYIDGIVDPELTGTVVTNDTFLLYQAGPIDCDVSAAIAQGAFVKPAAAGRIVTGAVTDAYRVAAGRAIDDGSGLSAGDPLRCLVNFDKP